MKQLNQFIDHTLLKADATEGDIKKICLEAIKYNFKAVCINPNYVQLASKSLINTNVKICTVVGFPLGASLVKEEEAFNAVRNGADEIDMVINISDLKNKKYQAIQTDIASVVLASQGKLVKVILETSLLTDEEIKLACHLALDAGAHYVKTSTGFAKQGGATVEAVSIMHKEVGGRMGVKASGGIRDIDTAMQMIKHGATRLGTSSGVAIVNGLTEKDSKSEY